MSMYGPVCLWCYMIWCIYDNVIMGYKSVSNISLETKLSWKKFEISITVTVFCSEHHNDVIMNAMASQITSLRIIYSTVCSGADQRKHQNSASLAFVRGIYRCPVNSPHKWPVTLKIFPFDDVTMLERNMTNTHKERLSRNMIQLSNPLGFDISHKIYWRFYCTLLCRG